MSFLISWFVLSVAVWLTARLLDGVELRNFKAAFLVAALFGVLNFLLGWFFHFILGLATLGIAWLLTFVTRFVVDAIILTITDEMTSLLRIESFSRAFFAAVLMSGFGTLGQWLFGAGGAGLLV